MHKIRFSSSLKETSLVLVCRSSTVVALRLAIAKFGNSLFKIYSSLLSYLWITEKWIVQTCSQAPISINSCTELSRTVFFLGMWSEFRIISSSICKNHGNYWRCQKTLIERKLNRKSVTFTKPMQFLINEFFIACSFILVTKPKLVASRSKLPVPVARKDRLRRERRFYKHMRRKTLLRHLLNLLHCSLEIRIVN